MKKRLLILIIAVFVLSSAQSLLAANEIKQLPKILLDTDEIYVGMSAQEILDIWAKPILIGYERQGKEAFKPILVKNPYRMEVLKNHGLDYEVMYFLVSIEKSDGIVSEEELVPLIFKQKKLIAKGRDFLIRLKKELM